MELISPSGRYAVESRPAPEERYRQLAVRDERTGETATLAERHAAWFSLSAGWDERERLWVRSGDTGTSVYESVESGWERRLWALDPHADRTVLDLDSGRELGVIGGEPPAMAEVADA